MFKSHLERQVYILNPVSRVEAAVEVCVGSRVGIEAGPEAGSEHYGGLLKIFLNRPAIG